MFKQGIAAFATLLGSAGAAQAQQSCTMPSVVDSVALNPVPGSDQMTVPIAINGAQRQFLLDIGTDHSEISAVAAAGLPSANQSNDSLLNSSGYSNGDFQFRNSNMGTQLNAAMMDVGGSRNPQDYAPRVRATTFTIGDATAEHIQLIIANDKEMGKSEPWDGRMTGDFFAKYDIDLDFAGRKLTFLTGTNCGEKEIVRWPASVVSVVPMAIKNGKISVPVTIDGHQVDAVIDTGSARTVMRRVVAEDLGLRAGTPEMMPDGDVRDGLGEVVYVHTFPRIAFGGVTAVNVPARIQSNSMVHPINRTPILGSRAQFSRDPATMVPDLAIGMDVLHQLHIYAAFSENKLYVTPARPAAAAGTAGN